MNFCKPLILLLSIILPSLSSAQALPQVEWQHTTAPQGDGTRAYLYGHITLLGPFPTDYPVLQPDFDARKIIATADGAYLVVPINAGGESENLRYLLAPYWLSNRGWQVLKLGPGGQVLWSRPMLWHLAQVPTPIPTIYSGFGGYGDFSDIRTTADGGLVLLRSGSLSRFTATGERGEDVDFNTVCQEAGDPEFPSQAFLTDEEVLVLNHGYDNSANPSRACALEYSGAEIERINATVQYLQVGDYRRNYGFLVQDGNWSQGQWSNSTLSLRSSSTVRWSKATNAYGYMQGARYLSASGETWINCGLDFCKYELDGDLAWSHPLDQQDEDETLAWVGDGLLLASDHSLRLRAANGSSTWQGEYGATWIYSTGASWQVLGDRVRTARYYPSDSVGRVTSIALADGQLLDDDVIDFDEEVRTQAFGLFGTSDSMDLVKGPTQLRWYRPFEFPCDLSGYCPYSAEFSIPEARIYPGNSAEGANVAASAFEFPLSAHPLERRSFPRMLFEGEAYVGVLTLQYVHDGVRNRARLERRNRSGGLQWAREFGFDRYDAAEASVVEDGSAVYVSATEVGPYVGAAVAKLWKFDRADGTPIWAVDLPYPMQMVRRLRTTPNTVDLCGISRDPPYRLVCVTPSGFVTQTAINGVPGDRRLRADAGSTLFAHARLLPLASDVHDRVESVRITAQGQLQTERTLSFEPVAAGQLLRVDASPFLGPLATAMIYANTTNLNRPIAMVVARFDNAGNRLWQRRIDLEQRGLFPGIENTSIAQAAGEIFVSMHPYTTGGTVFRTSVCQLSDSGELRGCVDSPRQGRIVNLFPSWYGDAVWVWQRGPISPGGIQQGMYFYRYDARGFSPELAAVETHQALAPDSFNYDNEYAYFQLVSNGTGTGRGGSDTQLVAIRLREEPILANGFED